MTERDLLELIVKRLDSMEARLDSMEADIRSDIADIRTRLENVTDKNIRTVAEGHLDLGRKLDEALKVNNEKELLLVRMTYLESEICDIKKRLAKLEQTA